MTASDRKLHRIDALVRTWMHTKADFSPYREHSSARRARLGAGSQLHNRNTAPSCSARGDAPLMGERGTDTENDATKHFNRANGRADALKDATIGGGATTGGCDRTSFPGSLLTPENSGDEGS